MTHIAFDRADSTIADALGAATEGFGQGSDFDGITQFSGGAVGFDIIDALSIEPGLLEGGDDHFSLSSDAGSGITDLESAIVVDGRAFNDSINGIAVSDGIGEAFEHDDADAIAEGAAVSIGVEGAAMSIRGLHAAFVVEMALFGRDANRDATGQGDVRLAIEQTLGGEMDGNQGSGAEGLHGEAGSFQVELIGDPSRQRVLIVANH